jgi:hypothetical protein
VAKPNNDSNYYRIPRPGLLWNGTDADLLPADGGKKRAPMTGAKSATKKAMPRLMADNRQPALFPGSRPPIADAAD